jgi:hypothetical protein
MFSRSIEDPDGYVWEIMWMECGGARQDARHRVIGATGRERKRASGLVRAPP